MQRFGGWLLMISGAVALGGYLTLPPTPDDVADPAEVSHVSVVPYHARRATEPAIRTFAPVSASYRDALQVDNRKALPIRQPVSAAWATTVISEPSRAAVLRSAKPADARTRYELARDLQRALKRAGCYWGDINGVWNPSTKRAMSAFMDRANATLPVKSPDYILLSLVENRREISCSSNCPAGQMTEPSGRCVPNAVVAQTSKRSKQLGARYVAETRAKAAPVAVAESEQLPWLDRDGRSLVAQSTDRASPPPGMMSIGGPGAGPSLAAAAPLSQRVVIERDNQLPASGSDSPEQVASLSSDDAAPLEAEPAPAVKLRKSRRAQHAREWRDERPRYSGHSKRSRRGDPRPGTMRYNVAQVLGGIY